jgi:hypothetical protein
MGRGDNSNTRAKKDKMKKQQHKKDKKAKKTNQL